MDWLILFGALLGILCGIVTGLTPGIHVNLITVLLLASSPFLLQYFSLLALAAFVIALSVTHTFLDSLPSIFLGAPESATALGVLPGHRYLLKGWGLMAVKLTLLGSLGAAILSLLLFPLFLLGVRLLYPLLRPIIGWLLLTIVLFMVLRDRKKLWALFVFLLAGTLGLVVLNIPTLENPLFPLLSGLFGVATLLISLREQQSLPEQQLGAGTKVRGGILLQALLSGQCSGFLTAMLPGIGAATAAVLSLQLTRDIGDHGYMILQGAINTVNFILSLATLLVIGKARNGAVIAVQQLIPEITLAHTLLFLSVALIAAGCATLLALWLGRVFVHLLNKVNYRLLLLLVIGFILLLTPLLSGWIGVLVLVTSTAVGMIPALTKVARVHGMGCLLLPVLLYFLL